MEVKQLHNLANAITSATLGGENLVAEDLSNLVDIGEQIFDARKVDNYCHELIDQIGKIQIVDRPYKGRVPSMYKDGWEYGSVRMKIMPGELPEAEENPSWQLEDGQSYPQDKFTSPKVSARFFNEKKTFQIPMSFADHQIKESFQTATQLNSFFSMIQNWIDTSMTVKLDGFVQRTMNKAITDTIESEYGSDDVTQTSKLKAVNLLYLYNTKMSSTVIGWTNLTAKQAVQDPGFIRYAAYIIGLCADRLTVLSSMFNINKEPRFTPDTYRHTVLLSEFRRAADVYLQSDTYHEEYTKLVNSEVVPYWQGPGLTYDFDDTSKIIVDNEGTSKTYTGIIGVMYDDRAMGITCEHRRVTTHYNGAAEFTNNWYKMDADYFFDPTENVIVFFVA